MMMMMMMMMAMLKQERRENREERKRISPGEKNASCDGERGICGSTREKRINN
jgi:hypothetical protein